MVRSRPGECPSGILRLGLGQWLGLGLALESRFDFILQKHCTVPVFPVFYAFRIYSAFCSLHIIQYTCTRKQLGGPIKCRSAKMRKRPHCTILTVLQLLMLTLFIDVSCMLQARIVIFALYKCPQMKRKTHKEEELGFGLWLGLAKISIRVRIRAGVTLFHFCILYLFLFGIQFETKTGLIF